MTDEALVLDANDSFYRIIRQGDFQAMEALWSINRAVHCTHPGWSTLSDRASVMRSWRMILGQEIPPQIWPDEARVILTGETAMVLCVEHLDRDDLMASNSFVREDGLWRMLSHQASVMPVAQAR